MINKISDFVYGILYYISLLIIFVDIPYLLIIKLNPICLDVYGRAIVFIPLNFTIYLIYRKTYKYLISK